MKIRQHFALWLGTLGLWVSALAQSYPSKPVKVVVGYAAGGAVDVVARTIGQSLQTSLGQPSLLRTSQARAPTSRSSR